MTSIQLQLVTMGILVFIIGVIAVGIYFGMQKIDTYLELKARHDCATISRFEITIPSDNTTVWYPVEDVYKQCLDEKGY